MDIVCNGMYFLDTKINDIIKSVGGTCQDKKERPIVALMQSINNPNIYWAIPMGDLSHRERTAQDRLRHFMDLPQTKIGSCYYHIAKTDKESIFFVSDAIPITSKYLKRAYCTHDRQYVIKNKAIIRTLQRKLYRILAYDKSNLTTKGKPAFRQNIFGIYEKLNAELSNDSQS